MKLQSPALAQDGQPTADQSAHPIFTDLSTAALGPAVELNSVEWLRLEGRLPWVEFNDEADVIWIFAGDTWPRNTVAHARFAPATVDRRIGEILARHLALKVACNWIVGPASQPVDLGKHLRAHGFRCMIHCAGMACDLNGFSQPAPLASGIQVTLSDEPPLLEPLTTERRRRRHEGRFTVAQVRPQQVWYFSAIHEGRPVGETTLFTGAGVAGIYNVEVTTNFRRRRIGSALVHAALRHSQSLGFRVAVLSATGMGQQLYARFNFREVCKLSFWKYGKMRQMTGA